MPLPEHEQRQLQRIEQALCRDDPEFVRRMRGGDPRVRYGHGLLQALPGVVIGAGLLAAGAVTGRVYLGAAGVVIVLLSLVRAVVSWRRYAAGVAAPAPSGAGAATATGTTRRPGQTRRARVKERMQERRRRRQEGNGGMTGRTRR